MKSSQMDTIGVRTVSGVVNSDGSIYCGTGFKAESLGSGQYRIRLAQPFKLFKSWLATGQSGFCTVANMGNDQATIAFSQSAGVGVVSTFAFTATGI